MQRLARSSKARPRATNIFSGVIVKRSVMTRGRRSRFIPLRLPARFLLAAVFVSAVQGCSTPGPVFQDDPAAWQRQFLADYPKDGTAAAHDLTVIAERWPDRLSQFPDATIAYVLVQTSAGPQAQFDLLRRLTPHCRR